MPDATQSGEDLILAVERGRKQATVRTLDMSFNELADMIKNGEIKIQPEYQRTFRWSIVKQSQFIESVLLEMPIPPIYVVEFAEGSYELIDGLQRLSTYLYLKGELDAPEREEPIKSGDKLKLTGCSIIPELNGHTFDTLPTALKNRARRAALRVEVIRHGSNRRFTYHMFTRLNSGGEPLSDQEARNCSIRLLDTKFNTFIVKLAKFEDFRAVTEDTTDEFRARMGLEELVLRYFAFKNNLAEYVHDIAPFLSDYMERVADASAPNPLTFDYTAEERDFEKVFSVLNQTVGAKACRRWVDASRRYGGGFSVSHYEAFSIGLARVADKLSLPLDGAIADALKQAIESAKQDPEMKANTVGGGKNFYRNYERKFGIVERCLRSAL